MRRRARDYWYSDPGGPAEYYQLYDLAGELEVIARRLGPVNPVAIAIARLAIASRRLAESEQSDPGERDPAEGLVIDPAPWMRRLEVDVFSVFMFGDLVLEAIGEAELEMRDGGIGGWVAFLNHLDGHPDPRFMRIAREAQLAVHEGRNLLVMHPGERREPGFGMDLSGKVTLFGWARDASPAARTEAEETLRGVADELGMAHGKNWQYPDLLDVIVHAGDMSRDQRERVAKAMRGGGYDSQPMSVICQLVRELAHAHAESLAAGSAHRT